MKNGLCLVHLSFPNPHPLASSSRPSVPDPPAGSQETRHLLLIAQLLAAELRTNFLALPGPLAIQIKAGYKLSVTFHKLLQRSDEINTVNSSIYGFVFGGL